MPVSDPAVNRSTVAVLKRIEARLNDSSRWCQRSSARDAGGFQVGALDPNAMQWCVDGAILVETAGTNEYSDTYRHLTRAAHDLYPNETGCVGINDHLGHAAILRVVSRAIVLAEHEAQP